MIDLRNVITDFPKASAYAVLYELVCICGVESVKSALAEIEARKMETNDKVIKASSCTCNAYQLENYGCKCGASKEA